MIASVCVCENTQLESPAQQRDNKPLGPFEIASLNMAILLPLPAPLPSIPFWMNIKSGNDARYRTSCPRSIDRFQSSTQREREAWDVVLTDLFIVLCAGMEQRQDTDAAMVGHRKTHVIFYIATAACGWVLYRGIIW